MGRHEVDIHDELLRRARAVLGTTTLKDTVRIALERVVEEDQRRAYAARLAVLRGLDADDPGVIEQMALEVDQRRRAI
jgi:Arc/MetJ family transcription regulator